MLVTDLIHWENHHHNEKSRQHNDSVTNILNRSSSLNHQHKVITNITVNKSMLETILNDGNFEMLQHLQHVGDRLFTLKRHQLNHCTINWKLSSLWSHQHYGVTNITVLCFEFSIYIEVLLIECSKNWNSKYY